VDRYVVRKVHNAPRVARRGTALKRNLSASLLEALVATEEDAEAELDAAAPPLIFLRGICNALASTALESLVYFSGEVLLAFGRLRMLL